MLLGMTRRPRSIVVGAIRLSCPSVYSDIVTDPLSSLVRAFGHVPSLRDLYPARVLQSPLYPTVSGPGLVAIRQWGVGGVRTLLSAVDMMNVNDGK